VHYNVNIKIKNLTIFGYNFYKRYLNLIVHLYLMYQIAVLPFSAFLVYISTRKNPQNNDVYAPTEIKRDTVYRLPPRCLLQPQSTFSKSVMMSMSVSKMG